VSNLTINNRQIGNVTVLDIDGNLRIGEGSMVLQKAIRRLLQEGQKQILLNLSRVDYIDSSGLGELVAGHVAMGKKGGQIKLLHLTHRVRELMTITKLLTVFDAYEDETAALDSFKTPDVEAEKETLVVAQGTVR
jgi:anti-sigma B factor antagonist